MKKKIRIGNSGGYWGDDLSAFRRQLTSGPLDYITMDFLAEITMSILQRQKMKRPELGYAVDFLKQLDESLELVIQKKVRVISNAGGINPIGLGREIIKLAKSKKLDIKVGVVYGDDIVNQLYELTTAGEKFTNMETGEKFDKVRSKISSANIYLGAEPVVKALELGCDIIVTGRVTDTGITLAPMIHEFGWAKDDWDKLAAGVIAGHIIECGAQGSGGNITDWEDVKSFYNIGYPIIEMEASGEFTVTKHKNTGGLVCEKSVKEQLVYEMGDPSNYISPDGVACFNTIQLKDEGKNRVRVFGIKGKPEPELLKVSMSFDDGYKASGTLLICGPDVNKKAKVVSDIFWKKVGHKFEETRTDLVGTGSIWPKQLGRADTDEIYLKFSVLDKNYKKVNDFGTMLPALILCGPSGMAVTGGGRPKPSTVVAYWPALMKRDNCKAKVLTIDTKEVEEFLEINFPIVKHDAVEVSLPAKKKYKKATGAKKIVKLRQICYARSGDKGDTANIGLLARTPEIYNWIVENITSKVVKSFFKGITYGKVVRYELDNLNALNFLLEETLGGGGTKSLMVDPQGKTLSQALLEMQVQVPSSLLKSSKVKK